MTAHTTYVCDRCYKPASRDFAQVTYISTTDQPNEKLDLCGECFAKFLDWRLGQ
jgi:hypothetical protein